MRKIRDRESTTCGIIYFMAEYENPCSDCVNNCCQDFKLFWPREEVEKLLTEYPFLKVVRSDVEMVNGREKVCRIMSCDRLNNDGAVSFTT